MLSRLDGDVDVIDDCDGCCWSRDGLAGTGTMIEARLFCFTAEPLSTEDILCLTGLPLRRGGKDVPVVETSDGVTLGL
jgi:hypothetical protein